MMQLLQTVAPVVAVVALLAVLLVDGFIAVILADRCEALRMDNGRLFDRVRRLERAAGLTPEPADYADPHFESAAGAQSEEKH